ncbi:MAG: hypothetical protein Q4G52_00360 [Clostridia bacterium]|nr:hypothetical protein [Clostridia bacterium]
MKRWLAALLAALALLPVGAAAQRIDMEDVHLAFDYPDSWLVVSPQLCGVYAKLLEDAGIDADALSEEFTQTGIHSRAYSADFAQTLSVVTMSDDLSEEIFDMARVSDSQRRTLRSRAENGRLFETTGMRVQDTEWQKENGEYWLYIHYTKTRSDELVGRGLRYVTVKNGMYVMLDWQISGRRFTARDLTAFRARISDLTVTQTIDEPVRSVSLTAQIPTETSTSELVITGQTNGGATLVAEAPDGSGTMQTLSVGVAGSSGSFSLLVPLPDEGSYDIRLTASLEGRSDASVTGSVAYSAKTLPVSLSGAQADGITVVTTDTVTLSGQTLAGVSMQLVTPFGLTKKRAGNDGSFTFELTTSSEGEYDYTLICDKSGYNQRRISFTLVREITGDQERARIKESAEKISYKNLQRDLPENQGKIMVIYGPVTQISSSGEQTYARMQYNKNASGQWYNEIVITAQGDMGVKEGDMATVVAAVEGVYEEQDADGETVIVPRLSLVFVDKVE